MTELIGVLPEVQGLKITPDARDGVATHFAAIRAAAEEAAELPLDDTTEPAWRFEA
ncbi:AtzG-like protein [Breoghania sp.]|uniref:AtzG-like protein n=1 Tax=Breoghania sp. TaxID=2065378 RepID=UPI00262637E6|nr:AtzG-like protein [Breoghania sp.]MDJ0931326.1 DUF4089 domain-containing protein [Breoghania sp.]